MTERNSLKRMKTLSMPSSSSSSVDLRLDEGQQRLAENLLGRLIVLVAGEVVRRLGRGRSSVAFRFLLAARDGENLLDDDPLRDDGAELVEEDEDLVDALVLL